jgi:TP901 family phage tail tape measure protein
MASTTRATAVIDFKANTTELEKLQKKLEKSSTIPMDDNLRNQFQTLSVETKQFIDSLKKIPAEDMTPDLVKELVKQKDKLFDSTAKLNKALLSTVDKSTGELVNRLQSEIKVLDKDIARRTKELEDMNKKFPDDPNKEGARQFGSPLKESQFIRETAEGEGLRDQMKGPSGQSIKDFGVMIQLADEMKKTFTESGAAYEKLNTHIESGKTFKEAMSKLTKAEREELEKVNGENFKNFSLQESINQIQIRKTLEQKKQDFLHKTAVDYANKQNNLELDIASRKQKQLQIDTQLANAAKNNTAEKQQQLQFSQELNDITLRGYAENAKTLEGVKEATKSATVAVKEKTKEVERNRSTLGKATQQVFSYGIAFTALRRIYRETLRTIRDLDKALTEMAIVTSMNRKETWQLVGTMQQLSRETGFTTTEIAKLSTIYFRQGRTLREVTELTRVAAIGARIAGISAAESADFLTSAVNAFQLSADQALQVSDKFAALAAQSASSYEELAVGLSKFAAQANVAGVSIDFAMGLLAKGVETTREAPETIGTALKTVIARMRELTDLGKTFEDGMDISRVETALRQVGVALRDDQGQFRNLELVLTELGQRWATLNTNQQASIAVSLAGTRQQSRLIAIMQDFDRTLELVDISQNSAGATMAQHTQFMRGMEAASVGLQNAYQQFITTITDSELIIGIIRGLSSAISGLANGLQAIGFSGQLAMISLMGIFTVLKLKAPVMKLINNSIIAQALAQERKRIIDLADIKIEKAKLLLNKKQISDSTKIRAQQILDNALETKKQALTTKGLILQKLQILGNKAELQSRITKIQSLIGEKIAKVGLIFVNGALLASTKKLIAGMLVFFKVLLTNPIGWIIIAVGLLIKGFMDLRKGNSTLAASFASSFKSIGNLVKSVFNAFMSLFKAIAPLVILVAKFKAVMMFGGIIAGLVVAFKALQVVLNVLAGVFNYVAGGIQFAVN